METLVLQSSLKLRRAELAALVFWGDFPKVFKFLGLFSGIVLLFGVAIFGLNAASASRDKTNSASIVFPVMPAVKIDSSATPALLGINIANNGLIFVRGAIVKSISGNVIQTSMSWGSADFSWAVETSGATKFLNHQGQKQTVSDIKIGDTIDVTGKLAGKENQFIINAEFVRE